MQSSSSGYGQMVSSMLYSHDPVSGPTLKRPTAEGGLYNKLQYMFSEGGLYRGKVLIICSAVYSESLYSHAAVFSKPHF